MANDLKLDWQPWDEMEKGEQAYLGRWEFVLFPHAIEKAWLWQVYDRGYVNGRQVGGGHASTKSGVKRSALRWYLRCTVEEYR